MLVRKTNLIICLSFLFALLIFLACKSELISDDNAAKIYVENMIVDEKYSYDQSLVKIHKQKVFEKFKTTEQDYYAFLKTLGHDNEKWKEFYKKAEDYLAQLKNDPNFY